MMKNKTSKFNTALCLYIVVLLSIIAIVWIILTLFLQSYEESQSDYCINEYIQTADNNTSLRIASSQLSKLSNIQDNEAALSFISQGINASTPVKYAKESSENRVVYYLHDGDRFVEKVTLVPGGDCGFGFHTWAVESEEYLLDTIGKVVEVNVPDGYIIRFNSNELDESYVTDNEVEYELLSGFYSFKDCKMPYLKKYSLGELFGDYSIVIKSSDGKIYSPEQLTEEIMLNNCSDDEKESIDEITNDFVYAYVRFLSNADRNSDGNYYNLIQYVESGSELESRLKDAKKSNGFNSSHGDDVQEINVLNYINIDGNYYIADIEFYYITTGSNKVKTEMTNHIKVMFRQSSSGEMKAVCLVQC